MSVLLVAALAMATFGGAVVRTDPMLGGLLVASGALLLPVTFCLWSWSSDWFRWRDVDHRSLGRADWLA